MRHRYILIAYLANEFRRGQTGTGRMALKTLGLPADCNSQLEPGKIWATFDE
jgi:hypothetical protein